MSKVNALPVCDAIEPAWDGPGSRMSVVADVEADRPEREIRNG
jgi:hypothetical protein